MAANHTHIAIIGGGAAGMMAAIFAGRNAPDGTRVAVFDGAKKLGAKILIAGGGRCNVTHDIVNPVDYFGGASRNTVKKILKSFSVKETTAFFAALGVELKREETGKLFPVTDKARTVLDALQRAMSNAGVEVFTEHRVTNIQVASGTGFQPVEGPNHRQDACATRHFMIQTSRGPYTADRVVLATGGEALPASGSDGAAYEIIERLGHTVTETWPALVPLLLQDGHFLMSLSGIALDAELTLSGSTGKALHKQQGAMLLTHFGLSGPAAMDMSRHLRPGKAVSGKSKLTVSFCPDLTFEQLEQVWLDAAKQHPTRAIQTQLRLRFPERFAQAILDKYLGIELDLPLARLSRDDRRALCHALTALPLPVVGDRGFKFAEVTAGGVPMDEVTTATMASKRCDGLYLCGEVLDVDGRIGGYNFQWAWCSGRLAGLAAATPGA
ncbi:NAD(P)/FAD-dependent oxidoreductase [Phycisphaeraceae bacterium D3-23]